MFFGIPFALSKPIYFTGWRGVMKITVLTFIESEEQKKYDLVVGQVVKALKQGKHKVSILAVHGDVNKLRTGLLRRKPDLVFNLMETFGSNQLGCAVGIVGLLDLLGVPYTGGGPGEFYIQEDKGLTKKLLSFDGIKYPEFAIFSQDADLETVGHLHMPLFVKPLRIGLLPSESAENPLSSTTKEMIDRVAAIHKTVNDAALVEEYIEGREFYIGVLGNQEPQAFPAIEMDFSAMPEGMAHVLDSKAKWDEKSAEYKGTKAVLADIPNEMRARLQKVAVDAYRALRVRDYGRIDMRLTGTGEVYVIEV